jgi:non-ribosomal peptide synthase protein (TIGR01720 family)
VSIPRSSEERVLKEVWEEILYKPKVNIERDNFFEIGGDSIKAIQIATKLSARGYKMDIRDIFLYSTIQDLAPRISKKQICLSPADKLNLSGEISFTPIQQWFYDTVTVDRDHFNQALYIELSHRIDPDYARQVFKTILQSHPVLRAKVTAHRMLQIDEEKPTDVLSVHEVGTEAGADEVIQKITNALQESFILESGPLFKAALIQRTNRTGIFLVAHHLVIDGMSWRILLNDLQSLMDRTQRSEPLVLDRFGNSFSDWSKAVNRYATRIPDSEVNFWRKQVRLGNKMPFSRDFPVETSLICDSTVANTVLSTEKTRMLRSLVYENLSIDLRTMVLTALVRSLAQQFKTNDVFLWLEGHGRETLGEDLELGNTIGWFTTLYPLAIEIDKNSSILQFAKATKQSLKSIPNGGVGFGALKYGRADALPKSDNTRFVFNFLGDYDVEMGGMGFKLNNRFSKNTNSVRQTRPFDVEVICYVLDKELKIEAMFSESQFKKTSIDSLLSQITIGLEQLCSLALNYSSPVVVPAEMTFSQIDQSTMDKLCGSFEVEDILPLSPTQTGMLLATMMDDRSSVYCQQTWYFLNMAVDKDHLQAAFQQLVNRHEMLRVRFIVDGMDEPLQLVSKKRDANISSFDASHLGAEQQSALIEKLKRDNRANQFDIEKDLLVRLAFIKLNSDRYFFLWTYHHIIIDGWAMRRVFTEFFAIYSALAKGKPTPPRPSGSYKQFLAWLSNQNVDSGKAYWKKYLTGFMQPSHIGTKRTEVNVGSGYSSSKMILNLDRETSRIIRSVARQLKATVNSMIQVAWSIVLSKFSKKDDVVFGIVVMQRPAEIRNVEAIVGLMINTIPLRVNIRNADSFAEVVTRVHAQYAESQSYNYVSLGDIQLQSAVGQKLFDHVMVFDGGEFGSIDSGDVPQSIPREYITDVGASGQTNYAFDMHITSSDDIVIYFRYNQVVYSDEFIYHLKTMFAETIDQVVQYPHRKLGELTIHRTVEVSKVVADFNKDLH